MYTWSWVYCVISYLLLIWTFGTAAFQLKHKINSVLQHKVTVFQYGRTVSYETGARLGLINIKTGRYRDPLSGTVLSIRDACLQGYIDEQAPAITDIQTGSYYLTILSRLIRCLKLFFGAKHST